MRKLLILVLVLLTLLMAMPVSADPATLMVDDDGVDCPDAGYSDIATAQDAADDGDTILVCSGSYDGVLVEKSVEIKGVGDVVITGGPAHPSGLSQGFRMASGSGGATISHLRFEVDLAIMNGAAVNDVTVSHNEFINPIQAVSNWSGDGWTINHNVITDLRTHCGGGIGILVADSSGTEANYNEVSHNQISGTLHVSSGDCGGYDGSGIVLYADYRWGRAGGDVKYNRVVKNKVSLVSDNPDLVDVWAFELTDTRDDPNPYVVTDNAIGFNDFRGSVNQIALTPEELENYNSISRNLGDNRGHGLHPSVFGSGEN